MASIAREIQSYGNPVTAPVLLVRAKLYQNSGRQFD